MLNLFFFLQANGRMIKPTALEYTHMSMEQNMKENGSRIFKMDSAKKLGLMDQVMKETIKKERNMEKVNLLKKYY